MIKKRRLEWLKHIAHMPDNRIPKQVFFGWLQQPCPQGGSKRRWKDIIRQNLKDSSVDEDQWCNEAVASYVEEHLTISSLMDRSRLPSYLKLQSLMKFVQDILERSYTSALQLHKCLAEHSKPVHLHEGGHSMCDLQQVIQE